MYKNPKATVDVVVEKDNKILLIIRCVEPHKGRLGLPGGHVNFGEKVEDAAKRETEEETGLKVEIKTILGVFSDPKREPNFPECHGISTVFIAEIIDGELKAGDDAKKAEFYKINELRKENLAFDHYQMIQDYLKWKMNGGTYWSSK